MSKRSGGRVEVITGGMFAGKSEELMRRINTLKYSPLEPMFKIYSPKLDTRYGEGVIATHAGEKLESKQVSNSEELLSEVESFPGYLDVVAIDEAQFLDEGLVSVVDYLANNGIRVIVSGLDMDFQGNPFGPMSGLLAIADDVTKLKAVCVNCGEPAGFSRRIIGDKDTVVLGNQDSYQASCRDCRRKLR